MAVLPNFVPSENGFHFANHWDDGIPDYVVSVPPIGDVKLGRASGGLCGGMILAVADLYLAHRMPPPDTTAPAGGTVLFEYIAKRLLDSFNIPGGVLTYYYWANTPDHDTGVFPFIRRGLAWMTIHDQLPQITSAIDAGRPAGLGLVTVSSFNPNDLGKCHQVLAYGYSQAGSVMTLQVYDPNSPDNDTVTIDVDISNPTHTTTINSTVDTEGLPIRGFFFVPYTPADPSAIAGGAQPGKNDAAFVSQQVPATIQPGQSAAVSVVMRNSGTTTWTVDVYRLGSQALTDNTTWGTNRVALTGPVAPGDQASFSFSAAAPGGSGATFQWQLEQDGVGWFGELTPAVHVAPVVSAVCGQLDAQIQALLNQIRALQQELNHAASGEKASIIGQIRDANQQLAELRTEKAAHGCP